MGGEALVLEERAARKKARDRRGKSHKMSELLRQTINQRNILRVMVVKLAYLPLRYRNH
jgi:hypothetical protein